MSQSDLFLPDRFEALCRRAGTALDRIAVPVDEALAYLDGLHGDMLSSGRGAFLIMRGDSGSGKSTFLHTIDVFRKNVEIREIGSSVEIPTALVSATVTDHDLRLLVIEGREALCETTVQELEAAVHSINSFLRLPEGERTLVVWQCNTDELREQLVLIAHAVGADALLGTAEPIYDFYGPSKSEYTNIARRTIAVLNDGASFTDLGASEERVEELSSEAATIGAFLGRLRSEFAESKKATAKLLAKEQFKLWVVVVAGNDPDGDVAALTRGPHLTADIDRLMTATHANVVLELADMPERVGILSAVLDVRIVHLPISTALAIAREFGDEQLHRYMKAAGVSVKPGRKGESLKKLAASDLHKALTSTASGTRTPGRRPGSQSIAAFTKLVKIARRHDTALNRAVGAALVASGIVSAVKTEVDLGGSLVRKTDLLCQAAVGPVRLEMMWRKRTGRADIANYVLKKLQNYASAIGHIPKPGA